LGSETLTTAITPRMIQRYAIARKKDKCKIKGTPLANATRNYDDFKLLHDLVLSSGGHHPGILVVRRDNNPSRDMSNRAIVQAVSRVSNSVATFEDSFHILNHWR
jgi:hypothetical protein